MVFVLRRRRYGTASFSSLLSIDNDRFSMFAEFACVRTTICLSPPQGGAVASGTLGKEGAVWPARRACGPVLVAMASLFHFVLGAAAAEAVVTFARKGQFFDIIFNVKIG